jgi:hypothetical protein
LKAEYLTCGDASGWRPADAEICELHLFDRVRGPALAELLARRYKVPVRMLWRRIVRTRD